MASNTYSSTDYNPPASYNHGINAFNQPASSYGMSNDRPNILSRRYSELTPAEQDQYDNEQHRITLIYSQKRLEESYPVVFAKIHALIVFCVSVAAIVIQILIIIFEAPYYQIGGGIWVSVYFFIPAILSIVTSKFSIEIQIITLYSL